MGMAEETPAHDSTRRTVYEWNVSLETEESQHHRNLGVLDEQEMNGLAVIPLHMSVDGSGVIGDPTYRAHVQHSNIHGNGEGLSGDVQLGSQCGILKALIAPPSQTQRDLDWFPHSRMTWKGVRVREAEMFSIWPTRVLAPWRAWSVTVHDNTK
jgi:hypothetical protein